MRTQESTGEIMTKQSTVEPIRAELNDVETNGSPRHHGSSKHTVVDDWIG